MTPNAGRNGTAGVRVHARVCVCGNVIFFLLFGSCNRGKGQARDTRYRESSFLGV